MHLSKQQRKFINHTKQRWLGFVQQHPMLVAALAICLYLLMFQRHFVFGGDAWAESFAEYLDESVRFGWSQVIAQGWAGYITIIPSFFAKLYVAVGAPLGYIDYFYRGVVLIFAVGSSALIAGKFNRPLIKSDGLRILLALCVAICLSDLVAFSFINVWYVGLIPVILYCLNPSRLGTKTDLGLGLYGALVALTKPFIILLPLIIYRLIRTKQYLGSGILLAAATLQSYQILFNDKRHIVAESHFDLHVALGGVFTGSSTAVFKLLHTVPGSLLVVALMAAVVMAMFIALWRLKGFWIAAGIGLVFAYSVYTYALAPDSPAFFGIRHYREMALFDLKTQREILINAGLLTAIFVVADACLQRFRTIKLPNKTSLKSAWIILPLGLLLAAVMIKTIDTTSAGVTNAPLRAFRQQLNDHRPTCVPLAPSTLFYAKASWSFGYKGACKTLTHDINLFQPDFHHMNKPVSGRIIRYDAQYFRLNKAQLEAVVIPVINTAADPQTLRLSDSHSRQTFTALADNKHPQQIQLVTFNVSSLPKQRVYLLRLTGPPDVQGGFFKGSRNLITYPYFLNR